MERKEYLKIIKDTLVNNGEYDFENMTKANKFAKQVLSEAEDKYSNEGYQHKYEDFKEFLYTHHADTIAYWIYEDNYSN